MKTEQTKSCIECSHWKPRHSETMRDHKMARCALGAPWAYVPALQTCSRHVEAPQFVVVDRLAHELEVV